jgi:hypothetical protein
MSGYKCFECGGESAADHHVVPRSRGGTKTVPLCGVCHAKAHHRRKNMATSGLIKDAMARKKHAGERVGKIPFGFDLAADGIQLVKNAGEQEVLDLVRQLRESGESMRAIATELNSRQISTKDGRRNWSHSTIQSILDRNRE